MGPRARRRLPRRAALRRPARLQRRRGGVARRGAARLPARPRHPEDRIPPSPEAAGALYRSLVTGRRLLVVLDNAGSSAQVRPLLPDGPDCATLVTSRSRLDGLIATDSARPVRLHALVPQDGVALLGALLGPERIAEEPEAAQELVALCDGLPLALRAASAQLLARPRWRLTRLATALRDERRRLALLSAEDAGSPPRCATPSPGSPRTTRNCCAPRQRLRPRGQHR
ncbi:NB-ARC domain-containing protein [Streptomyces sp. M19]